MKQLTTLAMLAALSAFWACDGAGSNSIIIPQGNTVPPGPSAWVEENRPVSGISGVRLAGVGRLFVQQGGTDSLLVRTQEHILPFIRTEMEGGLLVVGLDVGTSYNGEASWIEFHVTTPNPERLELRGTGGITASGINTSRMTLVHTGIGSIDLSDLTATRLDASRTGTGTINVSGTVQHQTAAVGGIGQYDTRHLTSAVAEIRILAGSSATVRVTDRLAARIDGFGSVYYFGDPVVERTGHGTGTVQRLGG